MTLDEEEGWLRRLLEARQSRDEYYQRTGQPWEVKGIMTNAELENEINRLLLRAQAREQ